MKSALRFAIIAVALLFGGIAPAQAGLVGFVNNPTGNSIDFQNYVTGQGDLVNTDVNFDTHPTHPSGALISNFYLASDGVTLTATGGFEAVTFGAGPGQANVATPPLSAGEGLHPASNYLFATAALSTLTISFTTPVQGAGLFMIDYYGPEGPSATITAYSGQNATGTNLGTFSSVQMNFQQNRLYFLGLASDSGNQIGSMVYRYDGSTRLDQTGIDNIEFAQVTQAVPEPSTLVLWSLMGGVFGVSRLRRQFAQTAIAT